jgi:hypothetical protein
MVRADAAVTAAALARSAHNALGRRHVGASQCYRQCKPCSLCMHGAPQPMVADRLGRVVIGFIAVSSPATGSLIGLATAKRYGLRSDLRRRQPCLQALTHGGGSRPARSAMVGSGIRCRITRSTAWTECVMTASTAGAAGCAGGSGQTPRSSLRRAARGSLPVVPLAAPIGAEAATGSACLERDAAHFAGQFGAGQGLCAAVGVQRLAPRPTELVLAGRAAVARPGPPPELNTAIGAGEVAARVRGQRMASHSPPVTLCNVPLRREPGRGGLTSRQLRD